MRFIVTFLFLFTTIFANTLSIDEAFKLNSSSDESGVYAEFNIADDIYIYQNSIKVVLNGEDITELLNFPASVFEKNEHRYYKNLNIYISKLLIDNEFKGIKDLKLKISYQGCSLSGYCYRPLTKSYNLSLDDEIYKIQSLKKEAKSYENSFFSKDKNFFLIVLSFFLAGLLLCLSPCSLPMIPILSSIIIADKNKGKKRAFLLSFSYVFSMALAYALLGILTSILGFSLQVFLQKPLVVICLALIFVLLALSCFGLFSLSLPSKMQSFISQKTRGGSFVAVVIMGFLSVFVLSACMIAPLAAALLYIANTADILLGGLALFALGFGMGLPLLLLGFGFGFLKNSALIKKINIFFGFLMLYMALYLVSRFINEAYALLAYSILTAFFVSFIGLFDRVKNKLDKVFKAFLILVLFLAASLFFRGFELLFYKDELKTKSESLFTYANSLAEIKEILASSKAPVMLDFTASWCVNCKLLDNTTFKDKELKELLKEYKLVKIDLSEDTEQNRDIMKEFSVFAPPVLLFFKEGEKKLEIVGYISAKDLLKRLKDTF